MWEVLGTLEAFGVQQGSPTEMTVPREVVTGGVGENSGILAPGQQVLGLYRRTERAEGY